MSLDPSLIGKIQLQTWPEGVKKASLRVIRILGGRRLIFDVGLVSARPIYPRWQRVGIFYALILLTILTFTACSIRKELVLIREATSDR